MPRPAPTQVGIKLVCNMYRKAGAADVSNVYHFNGPSWTNQTEFETVADALETAYKACLSNVATIVEAIGYNPGSFVPVYTKAYGVTGDVTNTSARVILPSDCAAVARFSTTQRTSKNHPIYLFKYLKPCFNNPNVGVEPLAATWKTMLETFADTLLAGYNDGTRTRIYCGPFGAVAQARLVEPYVSHRDFPS